MMVFRKTAALFSACVIAANILSASAQDQDPAATESLASSYKMAAVLDRARGNIVLAGGYERAIAVLDGKSGKHFASSTNLCVAYTMTGDLQRADTECDSALTLSEGRDVRRDIAVALSNLGVVKAVSGDLIGAKKDFTRAIELNR